MGEQTTLGAVCNFLSGNAWKAEFFSDIADGLPIIRIQNLGNNENEKFVYWNREYQEKYLVADGDILVSLSGSFKADRWNGSRGLLNQRIVKVIPNKNVDPIWLTFFLERSLLLIARMGRHALVSNVALSDLKNLPVNLPPLAEQRRIVDILSRAEGIVRLRREAEKKAAELIPALFLDMFGDPATNPKGWTHALLGAVADVQGGLQVTPARNMHPLELPYLRVANVHRSRLDLSEIKLIRLTSAEFVRTKLMVGDLLVVEGHGNPNEIGRVATWNGSITDCVHQNHIIRARCNPAILRAGYACEFLNSKSGRQFLLRSGKTTSGLNTISVSNVKAATILLPPIPLQDEFESRVESVRSIQSQQSAATATAQATFDALLSQVFVNNGDQ